MPRKLVGGLIQCSNPLNDPAAPVGKVKKAMFDKDVPLIEEAGKKGVQVLCLQEIFDGPYFCPSQDPRWYDADPGWDRSRDRRRSPADTGPARPSSPPLRSAARPCRTSPSSPCRPARQDR